MHQAVRHDMSCSQIGIDVSEETNAFVCSKSWADIEVKTKLNYTYISPCVSWRRNVQLGCTKILLLLVPVNRFLFENERLLLLTYLLH